MCGVGNGGVHYGLVSRVKPCSRAAFSRTSSPRFLATGDIGREGTETDSGRVCCLQHADAAWKSFAACLASLIVAGSSELGAAGSPVARSLLREDGSKARSYTPVPTRNGFGQVGRGWVIDADFLANAMASAVAFATGIST